jgi:hypothetical protein
LGSAVHEVDYEHEVSLLGSKDIVANGWRVRVNKVQCDHLLLLFLVPQVQEQLLCVDEHGTYSVRYLSSARNGKNNALTDHGSHSYARIASVHPRRAAFPLPAHAAR